MLDSDLAFPEIRGGIGMGDVRFPLGIGNRSRRGRNILDRTNRRRKDAPRWLSPALDIVDGLPIDDTTVILPVIMTTYSRFLTLPAGSFFLFGPRGTGKTTWLRSLLPDAVFVDLLKPEEYRRLAARPERLRERVLGAPPDTDVVIDEVQRVPELLNVVHDLMESRKGYRFILTGSSARKLRRGGVNLLAAAP